MNCLGTVLNSWTVRTASLLKSAPAADRPETVQEFAKNSNKASKRCALDTNYEPRTWAILKFGQTFALIEITELHKLNCKHPSKRLVLKDFWRLKNGHPSPASAFGVFRKCTGAGH